MINETGIIKIQNIFKSFIVGDQEIPVLKEISFEIEEADFAVIFGPSGCGKSTLLHCILGLEGPTRGSVNFLGRDFFDNMNEDQRADIRKKYIGMVYQQSNWVKALNVKENVGFPLTLLGFEREIVEERAINSLAKVGMEDWSSYMPTELSSGQQQKVALARSLIHNPKVIVADEPTGNLDYESGQEVMKLLRRLSHEEKRTILMVTHDLEYMRYASKIIQMFDGRIVDIYDENNKQDLLKKLNYKRGVVKNSNLKKGKEILYNQ